MADQVRDSSSYSSNQRLGLSKSQLSLHKILRIITSCSPPPPPPSPPPNQAGDSSNQGSTSSGEAGEADLRRAKRGIEIDLNTEAGDCDWLLLDGENEAASAAGSCLDCPATAAVEKSSEGECDAVSDKVGCFPASEAANLEIERQRSSIESIEAVEAVEAAPFGEGGGEEVIKIGQVRIGTDRRLTVLIEAAELADSPPSTVEEEEEEEDDGDWGSQSPSLRCGGEPMKRRRKRNKCWVVDLYKESERTTSAAAAAEEERKTKRSQMLPCRYRDSSVVLEPWRPATPHRRSPRLKGGGGGVRVAEPVPTAAVVSRKRKSR